MSFSNLLGFSTSYTVEGDSFYKYYDSIDEQHWSRIKNNALLLSNKGIGPQIRSIVNEKHCYYIEYQKVTPLDAQDKTMRPNICTQKIRENISSLIDQLHSLGYGHGDLHINNIGFIGDRFYILDHDSIYKIEDGKVEWLSLWMKEGFDWEDSFENFVKNDYDTWMTDWLDE